MINISPVGFSSVLLLISFLTLPSSHLTFGNQVNEQCTTPDSKPGHCIKLDKCIPLYDSITKDTASLAEKEFSQKSKCGIKIKNIQKFCCADPEPEPIERTSLSEMRYPTTDDKVNKLEILPKPVDCAPLDGSVANRIYGGNLTTIGEFPWMVLIEYSKGSYGHGHQCGGSLINDRYVLTAAHCIISIPPTWKPTRVRLGEWDTKTNPDCQKLEAGAQQCANPHIDVAIEKAIPHEKFDELSLSQPNDIALLRLASSITYTNYIRPICLPLSYQLRRSTFDGELMTVSGWGGTENITTNSLKLRADVGVVPLNGCQRIYGPLYDLTSSHLCAGGIKGIDSCEGDSGGPLIGITDVTQATPYYFLSGIVSFGPDPCGLEGWPGVYTNVSNYIDWILEKIE